MTTYALFIAADPDPVSESDWAHIDQVFDRARLSSGGTIVRVRSTESTGHRAEDFDRDVATFIDGRRLEVRDDGPTSLTWLIDGEIAGTATLQDQTWQLVHAGDPNVTATHPDADGGRETARVRLGEIVEDWLTWSWT